MWSPSGLQQEPAEFVLKPQWLAVWSGATKIKDPAVGSTGPRIDYDLGSESCRLRCLLLGYAFCLRAFLSLDNFELDVIAFLQTLVTF